jgi:hypothetical protein
MAGIKISRYHKSHLYNNNQNQTTQTALLAHALFFDYIMDNKVV